MSTANENAVKLRELTFRFELLLEQAEGFVRGGDYLGAQARARHAHQELVGAAAAAGVADADIVELERHLELQVRHYDLLAEDWQRANAARHSAHVARERHAIGAGPTREGSAR
jgi:hypothetical protein